MEYIVHVSPKRTWDDAAERCRQDGMHLLRIYSRLQGAAIHAAVSEVTEDPYWIGLSDAASEGSFVWTADDAPYDDAESIWMLFQPDDSGGEEDCVAVRINPGEGFLMNDWGCGSLHSFVCMDPAKVNACAAFPCTTTYAPSADTATCTPRVGTSLAPSGRTCACVDGYAYADDTLGCLPPLEQHTLVIADVQYRLFTHPFTWEHAQYLCRCDDA